MNTEFKLRLIIKFEVKWRSKLEPNKNKLERPSSANGMIVGFSENDDIILLYSGRTYLQICETNRREFQDHKEILYRLPMILLRMIV